eukprot:32410_1
MQHISVETNDDYEQKDKRKSNKPSICVAIDFGTSSCGIAYALPDGTVYIHATEDETGRKLTLQKLKSSVLFDADGDIQGVGNDAKKKYTKLWTNNLWKLFEKFKIYLYGNIEPRRIKASNDSRLSESMEKIFIALFQYLKTEVKQFMIKYYKQSRSNKKRRKSKYEQENMNIQWILAVPSIFDTKIVQKMRDWAIRANLTNQLKIVFETHCSALSILYAINIKLDHFMVDDMENDILQPYQTVINSKITLEKGDKYMLIDVGGGICTIAVHEVIDKFKISEVLQCSGGLWGSVIIHNKFEILLRDIFSDELIEEFCEQNNGLSLYQELLQHFSDAVDTQFLAAMDIPIKTYIVILIPEEFAD